MATSKTVMQQINALATIFNERLDKATPAKVASLLPNQPGQTPATVKAHFLQILMKPNSATKGHAEAMMAAVAPQPADDGTGSCNYLAGSTLLCISPVTSDECTIGLGGDFTEGGSCDAGSWWDQIGTLLSQ
jgi:hypothetical protein